MTGSELNLKAVLGGMQMTLFAIFLVVAGGSFDVLVAVAIFLAVGGTGVVALGLNR